MNNSMKHYYNLQPFNSNFQPEYWLPNKTRPIEQIFFLKYKNFRRRSWRGHFAPRWHFKTLATLVRTFQNFLKDFFSGIMIEFEH
jgi:hypothetical protein